MKIVISGTPYEFAESVGGASLNSLMELKSTTKARDPKGIGVTVESIEAAFTAMTERSQREDFKAVTLLGDEEFLLNIVGVMFLARKKAGEKVTFESCGDVSFQDFSILIDDDDLEDEAPKGEGVATDPEPIPTP